MQETIKLRRGTFQHIESELFSYHDTKREIVRIKNEILYSSGRGEDENVGGGRSNIPGDPTGRTAVLLTSHKKLEQLQAIVEAIETVIERLPAEKRKLVELRYWQRPQRYTWDGIAMQLNVSRITAMRWRDQIVYAVAEKIGWR